MKFVTEEQVFLEQNFTTQDAVLHFLAEQATKLRIASDQQQVYDKLIEREKEGTTGMMDGFAIPHAKAATIEKPSLIIVRLTDGIDWKSLDGSPTNFVIALFIPDTQAGSTHLKLLSTIARLLMRSEVTNGLKASTSASGITALLNEKLEEVEN